MKRYVQSKYSTTEPKPLWELDGNGGLHPIWYRVLGPGHIPDGLHGAYLYLPKSEYVEVSAPEMWERIGDDRITVRTDKLSLVVDGKQGACLPPGYRWAWDKQEDGTLVIERRVEP